MHGVLLGMHGVLWGVHGVLWGALGVLCGVCMVCCGVRVCMVCCAWCTVGTHKKMASVRSEHKARLPQIQHKAICYTGSTSYGHSEDAGVRCSGKSFTLMLSCMINFQIFTQFHLALVHMEIFVW